jgi:multidrug efflux pump subunit AcrA (membrane-fusion protein)
MNLLKISKTFVISLVGLGAVAFISYKQSFQQGADIDHNIEGEVVRGNLEQKITIAGNIYPEKRSIITAPYDGYIKKMFVKVGDVVKKGDPLVSVALSLQSTEQVFPLRSPLSGTVVLMNKQEGEFVKSRDTNNFIMRVDRLEKLYIKSKVPEIDMVKMKIGQSVSIKMPSVLKGTYKGIVEELSLASKLNEQDWNRNTKVEYLARIKILSPDKVLKPGMTAISDIVTMRKDNVLMLPHEYFIQRDENFFVILQDGTEKEVFVGIQNESMFEIIKGVEEGTLVQQVDLMKLYSQDN